MFKEKSKIAVISLAVFAIIAVFVYFIARTLLFFFASYTGLEKVSAVLLIFGELFVLLHGLGYVLNIVRAINLGGRFYLETVSAYQKPAVAILVASRHEPKDVLMRTVLTIKNINYPNKDFYLLDDSSDEKYKKEIDELSRDYDFKVFRREKRHGAKAGIINDCIKTLDHKYILIFDADQNPLPEFLNLLVPIMEGNSKLAFIQTPQFYSNIDKSLVSRGAAFQQAVFYEYICEGKSSQESMFCCGTNVIFRLSALLSVGGLDESTVTEDFATSLKLHATGWKSLYYNHVYAFGLGPNNLEGYFKQQFRWAVGTISVLKKVFIMALTKPLSLKFSQWWEYFLSGSYYLVGLAFFFLLVCPLAYIFFNIPSFFVRKEVYILTYLPYILLTTAVFYNVLRQRNYKIKDLFLGQLLGACTFPIYLGGAIYAILGIKIDFGITQKGKGNVASLRMLWPQLAIIFINIMAITWGICRFIYEREPAILVNGFWVLYHTIVLSSVFYFNQEAK